MRSPYERNPMNAILKVIISFFVIVFLFFVLNILMMIGTTIWLTG